MNRLCRFHLPTRVMFGSGVLEELVPTFYGLGAQRILVVTDRGLVKSGLLDEITAKLESQKIAFEVFDGVEPNPKDYQVQSGARQAAAFGAEGLLAFGGGSPIDCAKAMGVLLAHDSMDIGRFRGKEGVWHPSLPLLTVPTTAGTGSEVTFSSVITDTSENNKFTIKHPLLAPHTALLEPALTTGMDADLTAYTGMDALTHAVEAYTSTQANPFSDLYALRSIELVGQHLYRAFQEKDNLEARGGMLLASLLGGIAFSQADVASVHCLAEALGSLSDAPHGACNAVLLPHVMEFNMPYCKEKYAHIARLLGAEFHDLEEGARKAVEITRKMAHDLQLPPLKELGIEEKKLPIAAALSTENISTKSNPRPMSRDDYLEILKNAYE